VATKKQQESPPADGDQSKPEPGEQDKAAPSVPPAGVTGPGTGSGAPVDEQDRTPASTVLPSEAGPLVPTDVQKVNTPELGHPTSSTNFVAANAAQRSVPGSNHVRLVDDQGNDVAADDIFNDPDGPSMFVTTKSRVYQEFTYPGARTVTTQLLYPAGARVTLAERERFLAGLKAQESQG
jgi:hypothetical protein